MSGLRPTKFKRKFRENPWTFLGLVIVVVGLAWQAATNKHDISAAGSYAVTSIGFSVLSIAQLIESRIRKHASDVVHAAGSMFVAATTSTGLMSKYHPPAWLDAIGAVQLVTTFFVLVPLAVWTVAREQDERERKIVLSAASVAFAAVLVLLAGSLVLSHYTTAVHVGTRDVLVVGAGAWLAAWLTLQRRM